MKDREFGLMKADLYQKGPYRPYRGAILLAVALAVGLPPTAGATSNPKPKKHDYLYDIEQFKPSLKVPVVEKQEVLEMPEKAINARIKLSGHEEIIEPLYLHVSSNENVLKQMVSQIAKPGKIDVLLRYLKQKLATAKGASDGNSQDESKDRDVRISSSLASLLRMDALSRTFEKTHRNLTIPADTFRNNTALHRELLRQIKPFFSQQDFHRIADKMNKGEELHVDTDLLPAFARKMVKRYTIYKGPNCFHSALAFQSPLIPKSPLINVKIEPGYHRSMINYDELWRALNLYFYEIDPSVTPVEYGDTIIFLDVPKDQSAASANFKWVRHAASYLFGNYTFSKGSKSPNTPYSVKTVTEEWDTWKKYCDNLAIKVFRRTSKNVTKKPPMDLTDWLY